MVLFNTSKKVIVTVKVVSASLSFAIDIDQGIYYRILYEEKKDDKYQQAMIFHKREKKSTGMHDHSSKNSFS
jgi:hypothetical protein